MDNLEKLWKRNEISSTKSTDFLEQRVDIYPPPKMFAKTQKQSPEILQILDQDEILNVVSHVCSSVRPCGWHSPEDINFKFGRKI